MKLRILASLIVCISLFPAWTGQARGSRVVAGLRLTAEQTQASLLAYLDGRRSEGHVQQVRSFWIFNGLSVAADSDTLLALAARPEVRLIREDRWQQWVDPLSVEVGSDAASVEWNASPRSAPT